MEISISIIDKPKFAGDDEANARLLWAALMIGESVNSSSEAANVIDLILQFDNFSERQRFIIYMSMQRKNPGISKEVLDNMENAFHEYSKIKNLKGKTKEQLVFVARTEKWVNGLFNDWKMYYTNAAVQYKVAPLIPFCCTTPDSWDMPILIWSLPDNETEKKINDRIRVVAETITDSGWFPFFDSVIKNYFSSLTINSISSSQKNFLYDFLFEIPEPFSLNTSQLNLVRSNLSSSVWKLIREFKSLNEELKNIPFAQTEFKKIISLYSEKISVLKSESQKTIQENSILNGLKNEGGKMYKIYAGISSFSSILNFYKELGIVDISDILYCSEDMATRENLNNTRVFLFSEAV